MSGAQTNNAVLCAGRLYCDLVFTGVPNLPVMGTETFCEGLSLHAGGGAFITAAAFSALGWESALLVNLPAAPFDTIVLDDIKKSSVDPCYCQPASPGAGPQLTVAITGEEDRAFLTHKTGAALPDIDLPNGKFRHLHVGELCSLVEHPDLIEKSRRAGMTISVDCGWDADLLSQGAQMQDLLAQTDVFLPNESELRLLKQSGFDEAAVPLTVVKCGDKGARALQDGRWTHEPAIPTNVIDTTGAGDAFNGGFVSSWLMGNPICDCLASGNRCGSDSVQHTGGTSAPSKLLAERRSVAELAH